MTSPSSSFLTGRVLIREEVDVDSLVLGRSEAPWTRVPEKTALRREHMGIVA